jgi:hypothetical protein
MHMYLSNIYSVCFFIMCQTLKTKISTRHLSLIEDLATPSELMKNGDDNNFDERTKVNKYRVFVYFNLLLQN